MVSLHVVASFKQQSADPTCFLEVLYDVRSQAKAGGPAEPCIPRGMTANFQKVFGAIFDACSRITIGELEFEWLGVAAILREGYVIVSSKAALGGQEGNDYFLQFRIDLDCERDDLLHRIDRERIAWISRPAPMLASLGAALAGTSYGELLACYASPRPGVSSFSHPVAADAAASFPFVQVFYHYAWIIYLRVERDLITVQNLNDTKFVFQLSELIVLQRMRLINLDRYFFTTDRTNIKGLKTSCEMMLKHFNLEERYERQFRLHRSMEKQLQNLQSQIAEQRGRALKTVISFITLFGFPIALFGTVLRIDLKSDVVVKFDEVITHPDIIKVLLFSFSFTMLAVGIMLLVIGSFDHIDKMRTRRRISR